MRAAERTRRARRLIAVSLSWFASATAHASPDLQVQGETSLGMTDNAQSAPDVPLPGGTSKSAGAFLVLRPGLVVLHLSPRTVQRLAYTFDYNFFLARTTSSSAANRLEYRGFFDLAPRWTALVDAAATESDSYAAFTLAAPASGLLPLLPAGSSQLLTLGADEIVSVEPGPGWRAWERLGVAYATPLFGTDAPETVAPDARLGATYAWIADELGVEGRGRYAVARNAVRPDGTRVDSDRELVLGGVGLYRHDLGRFLTSGVEAGALQVMQLGTQENRWYPVGAATLVYTDVTGDAQLTYAHTVTTNLILGQSLLTDEVRLRGRIALDRRARFTLAATAGYQVGRILDETLRVAANVSLLAVDTTFGWQANPWLLVGLRAQHLDQRSDVRVVTLPVSFVQNTVMVGAALRFPPDSSLASGYRSPLRVDRNDERRGTPAATAEVPAPTGRAR